MTTISSILAWEIPWTEGFYLVSIWCICTESLHYANQGKFLLQRPLQHVFPSRQRGTFMQLKQTD